MKKLFECEDCETKITINTDEKVDLGETIECPVCMADAWLVEGEEE